MKILLIHFGSPSCANSEIKNSLMPTAMKDVDINTTEINKLPQVGERFVVKGGSFEDLIFECVRVELNPQFVHVEGHDSIIIAKLVDRYMLGDARIEKLESFRE